MNFPNLPRQPFVGLALLAALGIIFADLFPLAPSHWWQLATVFAVFSSAALFWPKLTSTYALVGAGFFLLHSFQIQDTPGLQLAEQFGERPRAIGATGFVVSEPKIASNGFATFLLKLRSVEFEGKTFPTDASLLVRWRGTPEFGDELKFFGIAEVIGPPRNPGEFDMRAYLARRDVRRSLFVRYTEDCQLLRHGAGNPVLRAAQKSRNWLQSRICRGLDDSPDVQNFLSGIALGLRDDVKPAPFTFLRWLVCTWGLSRDFCGCWQSWRVFPGGGRLRSSFHFFFFTRPSLDCIFPVFGLPSCARSF